MRPIILLFLLATFFSSCAPRKYFHYNEVRNSLGNKTFSHILIVGTGTSGTNLFLESLSKELNKRLKQKNIETNYFHLGNNPAEAKRQFIEIVKNSRYDAVLHFAQLDEANDPISFNSLSLDVPLNNGGNVSYFVEYRVIRFHQKYLMRYFDIADMKNSIMDVNVDINMNFINPKDYLKISDSIIKSLKID